MPISPAPEARRLVFSRLTEEDVAGFAKVLSDPEVTRSIMAKATTPEQCLLCARKRIAWHNSSWENGHGYGVWGLRLADSPGTAPGEIIGWCGLVPSPHGLSPELLYGLSRSHWGGGLATEAVAATIDWAFTEGICEGIDAIIFGPLNPGSAAVARKLGMSLTGKMLFPEFLQEKELGRDVLDYEIWRLREGACIDFRETLFQSGFKAGLIVTTGAAEPRETLAALVTAARDRQDRSGLSEAEITERIEGAFESARQAPEIDVYHLSKDDWAAANRQA